MIRANTLTAILSSLLLLAAHPAPADAFTHHFTSIEYPGSFDTVVYDINNSGERVGTYDRRHGFVYGLDGFASLDFGRKVIVHPAAIDDSGQIAGYYVVRKGRTWEHQAFVYDQGTIVDMDFPSSGQRSRSRQPVLYPLGINNQGTVVGMQAKPGNLKTRGFIYEDGKFSFMGPYRRGLNYLGGINNDGHMAGYSSRLGAFLYDGSAFIHIAFDYPLFPMDLNISDQVVGFYFGGDKRAHGFFYDDGSLLTIDYPGAALTFLTGINDEGDLAGWYREEGTIHSFVATPVPIPGSVWLLGAGLLSLALTLRSSLRQGNPSSSHSPNSDQRSS